MPPTSVASVGTTRAAALSVSRLRFAGDWSRREVFRAAGFAMGVTGSCAARGEEMQVVLIGVGLVSCIGANAPAGYIDPRVGVVGRSRRSSNASVAVVGCELVGVTGCNTLAQSAANSGDAGGAVATLRPGAIGDVAGKFGVSCIATVLAVSVAVRSLWVVVVTAVGCKILSVTFAGVAVAVAVAPSAAVVLDSTEEIESLDRGALRLVADGIEALERTARGIPTVTRPTLSILGCASVCRVGESDALD